MTSNALQSHLPDFSAIDITELPAILEKVMTNNNEQLSRILTQTPSFTWDNLMAPLEKMADDLDRLWAPIRHLRSVKNNNALRKIYSTCLESLTAYETTLGQNRELYTAIKSLAESTAYSSLTVPQKKVINDHLRDFKLSGVHLSKHKRKQLEKIAQQLSQQQNQFNDNILDATEAWTYNITEEKMIAGIPEHIQALAQKKAVERNEKGWTFTLDYPVYSAIMTYSENRSLREKVYYSYHTRASDTGPHGEQWDNSAIIKNILALRHEEATLLDYPDYCHYSLATKMANTPKDVMSFLENLAACAKPHAMKELEALKCYAQEKEGLETLEPWDVAYFSEQLKQQLFHINDQTLRNYFPVKKVLCGLFYLLEQLFSISFKEETTSTWDPEVQFFTLYNEEQQKIGHLYCDLFARTGKRGGAWMDECRQRHYLSNNQVELPVAFLTCNFAAPTEGRPSCLNHDDVVTLFHEMGHCLHHLLTTINYSDVSGINGVPWDAVEFPSQLLEQWCWQPEVLTMLSDHVETQTPLPSALMDKLIASRHFQIGLHTLRQIIFSLFDFTIHSESFVKSATDATTLYKNIQAQYGVTSLPSYYRFAHTFSHIFSGGYAAGYYSYKWAEVMAWDAFEYFKEKGCLDKTAGHHLRNTILANGGAYDAMDLFIQFRGRPPELEALLRHSNLL
ncbi:MAG: M3 family metallopeptidase [Gammaproteobacteria bacterium]